MLNALDWFYWHSFWAQCLYRTIAWLATKMLQGRFQSPTAILFMIWPIYDIRKVHNYVTLKPTQGFLCSHSNSWLYWLTFTGIKTAPLQIYNDLPPLIYIALKGWVGLDRSACWVIIADQEHPPLVQWEVCTHAHGLCMGPIDFGWWMHLWAQGKIIDATAVNQH